MNKIMELRNKRNALWEKTKAFLEEHRDENGLVEASAVEQYEKMGADVKALGAEIERLENQAAIDAEMSRPTSKAVVGMPNGESAKKTATGSATDEYKAAFWDMMRGSVATEVRNALSVGEDTEGGFTVPDEFERQLVQGLEENNIFRRMAHVIRTASGTRKIPIANDVMEASWIDEGEAIPETNTRFAQTTLSAYKLGTMIKVSNELLHDSAFDIAAYIADRFGVCMGNAEERAFITGTGEKQPTGLLHDTNGAEMGVTAASETAVTFDEIFQLYYALKAPYRRRAAFLCNEALVLQLMTIKDGHGQYIWRPSLDIAKPDTILGRPIYTSTYMPAPAKGEKAVCFGDYSYYWVADRSNRMKTRMESLGISGEAFDRALQMSNGNAEDFATALMAAAGEGTKYEDVIGNLGVSMEDLQATMDDTCGSAENMANITQDNLNGQMKILESSLQELSIAMMDTIMPAIRKVVEKVQSFVNWLNSLDDRTKKLVVTIGMAVAAIGPVLLIGGKLSKTVGGLFKAISKGEGIIGKLVKKIAAIGGGPVAGAVAAIAALAAAFIHLWRNNEEFRAKITAIWDGVKKKFEVFGQRITDTLNKLGFNFEDFGAVVKAAVEAIKRIWDEFCNLLAPVFEGASSTLSAVLGTVLDVLAGLFQAFASLFSGDWGGFWEGIVSVFTGIWDGMQGVLQAAIDTIKGVIDVFLGWFGTDFESVFSGVSAFLSGVWTTITGIFTGAWDAIRGAWETVAGFFEGVWTAIQEAASLSSLGSAIEYTFQSAYNAVLGVWNSITGFFEGIWSSIMSSPVLAGIVDGVSGFFSSAWDTIKTTWEAVTAFFSNVWKSITGDADLSRVTDGISGFFTSAWDTIKTAWGAVTGFFSNIWKAITGDVDLGNVAEAISSVFTGAWDAIKKAWDTVTGFFSGIWKAITGDADLSEIVDGISGFFTSAWKKISETWEKATGFFSDIWTGITSGETLKNIGTSISGFFTSAWDTVKSAWDGAKTFFDGVFDGIYKTAKGVWDKVSGWLGKLFGWGKDEDSAAKNAETSASEAAGQVAEGITNAFSGVNTSIANPVETGANSAISAFSRIRTAAVMTANAIVAAFSGIQSSLSDALGKLNSSSTGPLSSLRTNITSTFTSMQTTVASQMAGITNRIKTAMENAAKTVQTAMLAIKRSTNFTWSLPNLKLPHITVRGSWSMNPPQVPSFSVRWYKDAMRNGIILNSPTIFGSMNGKYLGAGDAGSELVVGTENLMAMIRRVVENLAEGSRFQETLTAALRKASESMMGSHSTSLPGVQCSVSGLDSATGRMLLSILSQYLPYLPEIANMQMVTDTGALVGQLAPQMDQRLGVISYRQRRQ